jgi:hypothetical protein
MESPYATPEAEMPEPKSKPWRKWLLWGCLGSTLAFVLLIGSCVLFVKGAMKVGENEFGPACAQYLALLESKDFSGAYELTGDEFKKVMTQDKHNALMSGIIGRLGPVKKLEVQFVQSGIDQRGKWGLIIYKTEFQNGPGTIKFTLRKVDGKFVVVGAFFDSPVLTELLNDTLSRDR